MAELRDAYALDPGAVRQPPRTFREALREIGPGIILAGSIVGTGELIATTNLGAKVGFTLLWLVIFSCFIKVFVQIELGRYAIAQGKTTLEALRSVPYVGLVLVFWWLFMMLATFAQLGAMVDGVAQSWRQALPEQAAQAGQWVQSSAKSLVQGLEGQGYSAVADVVRRYAEDAARAETLPWAVLVTLATIALLITGSYRVVQNVSLVLVCFFTVMTIVCVAALPWTEASFSWQDIVEGLKGRIPQGGLLEALGMFGITGVGASELLSYPYWCIEKGYARWTGPRTVNGGWVERARGWLRVMRLDAWGSMVIYTTATIAFYVLGAAVLFDLTLGGGLGEGTELVPTLIRMYEPVLGKTWATLMIVVGAIAVLFSTLFVSSAANARMLTDFLYVTGCVSPGGQRRRLFLIRLFCVLIPLSAFALYAIWGKPVAMVVFGGLAQAVTLPMIASVALYLRYTALDPALRPGKLWDAALIASTLAFFVAAGYLAVERLQQLMGTSG